MKKKVKCYTYIRVSTSMQVEGYSLEAQRERLNKFADFQDIEVVREYCDAGKSGKNITGRPEFSQMLNELVENALKYSKDEALFTLSSENGRIRLTASNSCSLFDGSVQQAFDRFTTLQNAGPEETGLGLAYVKDIVLAHNGRPYAEVKEGRFEIRLEL